MTRSTKASLAGLALLLIGTLTLACEAETGPDAPKRQNGCIDISCANPQVAEDAGAAADAQ